MISEEVLERVRHLHLRARQAVAGLYAGPHRSVRLGQAVEFADYKPYLPGDSLRDLDWRVLARSDRTVVKRYRAETEMRATIVFDASADLGSVPAKWEQAVTLAATLATFLQGEGAPVGLVLAGGEAASRSNHEPRRGAAHLARVLHALASVRPAGRAGLAGVFAKVGGHLTPRAMVVVVSDFMEEPAEWAGEVAALTQRRADLRAFHLWDRGEYELRYDAPLRLRSPETSREEPIDPDGARAGIQAVAETYVSDVRTAIRARRGLYQRVESQDELTPILGAFARGAS